ncbi:hypothetical protein KSC_034940 [Ktedonobacter sp. SOSP1-52]|nr:hypothetical protein KSC_034940 [Ktedonobacter sp. SOSP1-52]
MQRSLNGPRSRKQGRSSSLMLHQASMAPTSRLNYVKFRKALFLSHSLRSFEVARFPAKIGGMAMRKLANHGRSAQAIYTSNKNHDILLASRVRMV